MPALLEKEALSVSELNVYIKEVLKAGFPQALWVCGEIQGYDRNKSKRHIFFELCEKDSISKDILARIGLVIFDRQKVSIDQIIKSAENAFELKDDIEVKFLCRMDFYPPHGAVRLIVEGIDPVYTLGKIAQEKQRLIAYLKKEGVLDRNKTLSLPLVPLRIGLMTAFDSAAYNDFCSELKKSGFAFKVFFKNCLMQGKNAPEDVCRALTDFNQWDQLDTIVITRGGGSLAELSCFDNELIARCIAQSSLPVLSGIGHEINITITDLAAHTYEKTPTAIAQFLVQRVEGFLSILKEKCQCLLDLAQEDLLQEKQKIKDWAFSLKDHTLHYFKEHQQDLIRFNETLRFRPVQKIKEEAQRLISYQDQLIKNARLHCRNWHLKMNHFEKLVEMISPQKTLKRGFSMTRGADGRVIKSIRQVKAGQELFTQVVDGIIPSQVEREQRVQKKRDHKKNANLQPDLFSL